LLIEPAEMEAPYGLTESGQVYEGTQYKCEIAKSDRAGCKGRCKEKICKGSVKFVSISNRGDYPMAYGRKIACVTETVLNNALKRYGTLDALFDESFPEDLKVKTIAALQRIRDGEDLTEDDLLLDETNAGAGLSTDSLPAKPAPKRKAAPAKKPAKKKKKADEWDSDAEESSEEEPEDDGDDY